jgi:hypothetical protein
MDIAAVIAEYSLSVRHIPRQLIEVNEIRHRRDGDEVFAAPNGRQFVKRVVIPKHAGMFMVKAVSNTFSTVRWDARKDNLAPTLEESIRLFLNKEKARLVNMQSSWEHLQLGDIRHIYSA